jgi:Protein of unknown function (DUF2975)
MMVTNRIFGISTAIMRGVTILLGIVGLMMTLVAGFIGFGIIAPNSLGDSAPTFGNAEFSELMLFPLIVASIIITILVLNHLIRIIASVSKGDIFSNVNSAALRRIALYLIILQIIEIVMFVLQSDGVSLLSELSFGGWLGALMAYVFAHVFSEGTLLREEAAFTV